jgi:hypothetical protein
MNTELQKDIHFVTGDPCRFLDLGKVDREIDYLLYVIDMTADCAMAGDMARLVRTEAERLTPEVVGTLQQINGAFGEHLQEGDEIRWKGKLDSGYYGSPTGDYSLQARDLKWFLATIDAVRREAAKLVQLLG